LLSAARDGESMRVDDLAGHAFAGPHMTRHTAIRRPGGGDGEMLRPTAVAANAEVCLPHGAEAEAMLIEMARRAQAATQRARGGVTGELSSAGRGYAKAFPAERGPSRAVAVQHALNAGGEVLALQSLLELRLVAAAARRIPDGPREVGMVSCGVTLPAAEPHGRMNAGCIRLSHALRVARGAPLHVDDRARVGARSTALR